MGCGTKGRVTCQFAERAWWWWWGGFLWTHCDVRDPAQVGEVMQQMEKKNFLPNVVVLNAGIYREDLDPGYNFDQFKEIFSTNVFGAFIWIDSLLQKFLNRRGGKFVVVSSVMAFRPDARSVAHSASQTALSMILRNLNVRYHGSNVQFVAVYLGPVATEILPRYAQENKRAFFILQPEKAVQVIAKAINGRGLSYASPRWLMLLFQCTYFLPDWLFTKLIRPFRR